MAGTAFFKKQNTNISSETTTNLNTCLHYLPAKTSGCLLVQQSQVVESNTSGHKCNLNNSSMKQNTTNNHNRLNSSCRLDDRILTNYSSNIKSTLQNRLQPNKQRPLTLSIAVIIMSLTILLLQKPAMVHSKSIYAESVTNEDKAVAAAAAETSAELEMKLLSSLSVHSQHKAGSLDVADVIKHVQRSQQHQRERMRLRKRHTGDLIITKYLQETAHNLEWKNPCNVDHVNEQVDAPRVSKQQVYQYLRKFERDVGMQYELINAIANTININDMADWSKHDQVYEFLPKLNVTKSISLSRWYRHMQVYVASFAYLARSQYNFDQTKLMFVGQVSDELDKLLASARFVLCELETTINGSAPNNNLKKLRTISRKVMNDRLNFVTKHQLANGRVVAANIVDLKFAKYSYYQFLLNMQKTLEQKLRNKARKYGLVDSTEYDNDSKSLTVGDDTSSLDFSSIFKSDSSLNVEESVEMLLRTTKKPHAAKRRRSHKRNQSQPTEA